MIDQLESELRSAMKARADDLPRGAGTRIRARDYRPRTRDLRPPVAAGVLTTAAAAAAAVLLIDLGPQAPAAFAGWSATPTHASTAQVTGAQGDCTTKLAGLPEQVAPAAAQRHGKTPLLQDLAKLETTTPVLTDTRGPFTFVVYDSGNAHASCISGPGFTSVSMQSATVHDGAAPAGKIVPSFQVRTARAGHAYAFVEGRAGDGVTAATLVLSDGSHVQATLQNGWLVAWWPGSAQLTSALLTTASGTNTQKFDTKAGCLPPAATPPSGSTTPSDSTTPPAATPPGDITTSCAGAPAGKGQGQAAGSMSLMDSTARGKSPAGGGTVTSTGGSGQMQESGTVTNSSGT